MYSNPRTIATTKTSVHFKMNVNMKYSRFETYNVSTTQLELLRGLKFYLSKDLMKLIVKYFVKLHGNLSLKPVEQ